MRRLALVLLIGGFWAAMNFLLWRSEFSERSEEGVRVSLEVIRDKLLTASDDSTLTVSQGHRTNRIGYLKWSPAVVEAPREGPVYEEELPPLAVVGYTMDVDGDFRLTTWDIPQRLRVSFHLVLTTNLSWRELSLRLHLRPNTWELRAIAEEGKARLVWSEGGEERSREVTLEDLKKPESWAALAGVPWLGPLIAGGVTPFSLPVSADGKGLGLQWEPRNHAVLRVLGAKFRCYKLTARILDRWQMIAYISNSGEVLKIELPGGLLLQNDALPQ